MTHEGGDDASEPLDLRELFARPWSGPATMWRPWWLRWLPLPSPVHFRTEVADAHLAETTGLTVTDTMTFSRGKPWVRTMNAQLVGPGRWRVIAEDMPGGAEQTVTEDGFAFTPFTILAPVVGPLRVRLRCTDEIILVDGTMVDSSELRFVGVLVARVVMRLTRE